MRIRPSGKVHIHTGVGNLGTFSHSSTSRIAAEVLKLDWEKCVIQRGDTRRNLPWNIGQFGSNTSSRWRAPITWRPWMRCRSSRRSPRRDFGGSPDDYDIDGKRVFAKGSSRHAA